MRRSPESEGIMKIVIDLQGAQTGSRFRGIGRYTLSLVREIVRQARTHEIVLVLNGMLADSIPSIRLQFPSLPPGNIRVWHAPGPVREADCGNEERRFAAECIREAFIASLNPDIVLITTFFESFGENAVTSLNRFQSLPTAVILYDLIPLINPDSYIRYNKPVRNFFRRKAQELAKADCLLAISDSAGLEAIQALHYDADSVFTISSGCDTQFKPPAESDGDKQALRARFGISRPYVMYSGGCDERKNLSRLIQAFAAARKRLHEDVQLVLVGKMPAIEVNALRLVVKRNGLNDHDVRFTGYVSDHELHQLYAQSRLFVFPSYHEGFGLPPLEAMACGAAVICSYATSLAEVVDCAEAQFDPFSVASIADSLVKGLSDAGFRQRLLAYGQTRYKQFTWERSARAALDALETVARRYPPRAANSSSPLENLLSTLGQRATQTTMALLPIAAAIARSRFGDNAPRLLLDEQIAQEAYGAELLHALGRLDWHCPVLTVRLTQDALEQCDTASGQTAVIDAGAGDSLLTTAASAASHLLSRLLCDGVRVAAIGSAPPQAPAGSGTPEPDGLALLHYLPAASLLYPTPDGPQCSPGLRAWLPVPACPPSAI